MSISQEITRIQNAKSSLKTSINAKTDQQHQITNETIDDYSEFVDSITSGGGGLDWSAIGYNATPQSIVDGYNYAKNIYDNWDATNTSYGNLYSGDRSLIIMPNVDMSNLTSTQSMLYNDTALIDFPVTNLSSVTNAGKMFQYCSALQSVGNLDLSSATSLENMFNSCTALKSVGNLDTRNATDMNGFFYGCSSLTSIGSINTSKNTSFASMFSGCNKLTTLPQMDTSKCPNFYAFCSSCYLLTTVPLLNTSAVTANNGFQNTFQNCRSLNDTSLDNILNMCINATSYNGTKKLSYLGITKSYYPASRIEALPSYQDFITAGWIIGY